MAEEAFDPAWRDLPEGWHAAEYAGEWHALRRYGGNLDVCRVPGRSERSAREVLAGWQMAELRLDLIESGRELYR